MKTWSMIVALLTVSFAFSFGTGVYSARAQYDDGYVLIVPPPLTSGAAPNAPLRLQDMYPSSLPSYASIKCWLPANWIEGAQGDRDRGRPMSEAIADVVPCETCRSTPEAARDDDTDMQEHIRIIKETYAGKNMTTPTCPSE